MLFNSLQFLIFFPIVLLVYNVLPNKIRYIWLLLCSYYFYMCWNAKYAILILFSTFVTYSSGLLIDWAGNHDGWDEAKSVRMKKLFVALSFLLNLSVLFFFKYFDFALNNINQVLKMFHLHLNHPAFDIMLPVGISFYTFQALSYTMDVYRKEIYPERNFLRYALFVSFFPQLVAGPIERSKNLLKQLAVPKKVAFADLREGLLLMLWGFYLKIVLADRIAIFVDSVYNDVHTFGGCYVIIATILFAVQIYCDFSGYSVIAMGASKMIGIQLMENFNAPYLSRTVAEFWRRWHISLSTWFRDYLYIPLGGNRKGTLRKYFNLMIVFLASGLWHGANWSYVVWGGLNGIYQIIGSILKPVREQTKNLLHLRSDFVLHKIYKTLCTFALIDFSWIFFRADSIKVALSAIKSSLTVYNPWILINGALYECGLTQKEFILMLLCIAVLLLADCMKYRGICVRNVIARQHYFVRCFVIVFAVLFILLFGVWGPGYDEANFIYFQF